MVRGVVGWLRIRPLVTQLPEHPDSETTGPSRFLLRPGLGFVTARDVVVLAGPAPLVPAAGSPPHHTSMTLWHPSAPAGRSRLASTGPDARRPSPLQGPSAGKRPGGYARTHAPTGTSPPWPVAVERRQPVHRVARRRPHRGGTVGGPRRRAAPGRKRRAWTCGSSTRRCWPGPSGRPTWPSRRPDDHGCPSAATGGSTSVTTAPCRGRTSRRRRQSTGWTRCWPGDGATPRRRRRSTRAASTTRPATPATVTSRPTPCPPPSAWPTS